MLKYTFSLPATDLCDPLQYAAKKLRVRSFSRGEILKKSLDARNKNDVKYLYTVGFSCEEYDKALRAGAVPFFKTDDSLEGLTEGATYSGSRPVVVGEGPCGLFAALTLAVLGAKPLLVERGKSVEEREKDVNIFFSEKILNKNSNVLFGAGGAGTFSDGKLNTGTNNPYVRTVLYELAKCGAPEEIVYLNKPHVGTDKLRRVVKNIEDRILALGGSVAHDTTVIDVLKNGDALVGLRTDKGDIFTDRAYFAVGHSARDTFENLYRSGVAMIPKTFSVGVRIEHKQTLVDLAQYGRERGVLPPADYKMAVDVGEGRKLYTFCMCPGGVVVNASSEEGGVNVNGMSYYARDGKNANSAILVNVTEREFGSHPLDGVAYQREWERRAYRLTNGFLPPAQTFSDFCEGKVNGFADGEPTCLGGTINADLNGVLPDFVAEGIKRGVPVMGRILKGFDSPGAVLTGPETRSSCPLRILRDEKGCSNIKGLYPMGEGAGYAGGITSAAADGIRVVLSSLE